MHEGCAACMVHACGRDISASFGASGRGKGAPWDASLGPVHRTQARGFEGHALGTSGSHGC